MAQIDHPQRIIDCKVVYFGPAGAGKTANLIHLWNKTKSPEATWMRLDAPGQSEARYYDYLPIMLGEIRGYKTRFHLFTVPGAPGYASARRLLLERVDGLIFVADSRRERAAENVALFQELQRALQTWGFSLAKLPLVIQCNMSDAPTAVPCAEIAPTLLGASAGSVPAFPSAASSGAGVFDTLKAVVKLVLHELSK
jgi:mutual gliding-motility protein MglA